MATPIANGMLQGHWSELPAVCWRQWRTERDLRGIGLDFRTSDPAQVRRAYSGMSPAQFEAINARCAWASARTLGRSLAGLVGDRPLRAIDLGSGTGTATGILARLLPAGSRLIGIELAEPLAELARANHYQARDGSRLEASFVVGSLAETFRNAAGISLDDAGIDLVNATGVLGHHLAQDDLGATLDEIARVLAPGGLAVLDVGPKLPARRLIGLMESRGFAYVRRSRSQLFDRTGQVVFRKAPAS